MAVRFINYNTPINDAIYPEISQIFNCPHPAKDRLLLNLTKKYGDHYLIFYFIGYYHENAKQYMNALKAYDKCISMRNFPDAYLNIARIFHNNGNIDNAIQILEKGANLCDDVRIFNYIGAIHYTLKKYEYSIKYYEIVIRKCHDNFDMYKCACNNMGFSYTSLGNNDRAIKYYRHGLSISPISEINTQLINNLLLNYDYALDLPNDACIDYTKVNAIYESIYGKTKIVKNNYGNKKIRIGYVSPDFKDHVCAYFIRPLLKFYDKNKFEVCCYHNNVEDAVSAELKQISGIYWRNIHEKSTDKVCGIIKADKIDILVDLAGHTNGNRLDVFHCKPANVQVSYLGFPNTTGLSNIDCRISDHYADPIDSTQMFTEKIIRMPQCFLCFTIPKNLPEIELKNNDDPIVFGVTNKSLKYNDLSLQLWEKILSNVPNSRITIKAGYNGELHRVLNERFIILDEIKDKMKYYGIYNNIDICLDTFPYSGTTTTCDVLCMSTPVITMSIPNRHVSNVTTSILSSMGHVELIAKNMDEYINIASALAFDRNRINKYKTTLRAEFGELMNEKLFMRDFDNLLLSIAKH